MNQSFALLRILTAFPRGRTTDQILAGMGATVSYASRRQATALIADMVRSGAIVRRGDLWHLPSPPAVALGAAVEQSDRRIIDHAIEATARLVAVVARTRPAGALRDVSEADGSRATFDPQALLRYYAASLRRDPRGAVRALPERHGIDWQLMAPSGRWWPETDTDATLAIRLDDLSGPMREALSRRADGERALSIGWPLILARDGGLPTLRPAGLLAAEWTREDGALVLRVAAGAPSVNPEILPVSSRAAGWSRERLEAALIAGGDEATLFEFGERLSEALASLARDRLDPARPLAEVDADAAPGGAPVILNAVAIFLPDAGTSFVAGAARDLDVLAATDPRILAGTALGRLLSDRSEEGAADAPPVLNPGPVNAEQIAAAAAALRHRLSVVTGPPGTGKSQAIVAMAASVLAAGGSVLVASRNHQALDAVEDRLSEATGAAVPILRTLDPATGRDLSFDGAVAQLLETEVDHEAAVDTIGAVETVARRRDDDLNLMARRRALHMRLAGHVERLRGIEAAGLATDATPAEAKPGPWRRLLAWMRSRRAVPHSSVSDRLPHGADAAALARAVARDRAALDAMAVPGDIAEATASIAEGVRAGLSARLAARTALAPEARQQLWSDHRDKTLAGATVMDAATATLVVGARPVWLATTQGAPKRIPLVPALFDLVIFDEASQCDIASALPLLARAKRAVVVGDARQLSFIPQTGRALDRNLMDAHGLPGRGRGRWAQGLNSLYDCAASAQDVPITLLRDQYRSAPEVTDYISDVFYDGRLRAAVDPAGLRPVPGLRPGLHWTDVPGRYEPRDGGATNPAEAAAIARHLAQVVAEGFDGTIGVVTPVRAQVQAIARAVHAVLPAPIREARALRIDTVDAFQGQERDLILFSPVVCAAAPASTRAFLSGDARRINVAISRARSVAHVMGDLAYARNGGNHSLRRLAAAATERGRGASDPFESQWERRLFAAMTKRGHAPEPQYQIAGRRLDFALSARDGTRIDVEVDGRAWHMDGDGRRKADDVFRDAQLRALGWRVLRFWVDELDRDMEGCLDRIDKAAG